MKGPAKFTVAAQLAELGADGVPMSWLRRNAACSRRRRCHGFASRSRRRCRRADIAPISSRCGCVVLHHMSLVSFSLQNRQWPKWSAKLAVFPRVGADVAPTDRDRGRCRRCVRFPPCHVPILRFSKSHPSKSLMWNSLSAPPRCGMSSLNSAPMPRGRRRRCGADVGRSRWCRRCGNVTYP